MKKFIVSVSYEDDEVFFDVQQLAENIAENIPAEIYDEMLDDCYGDVDICGIDYSASLALYRVDEIAYTCGFNDYKDSMIPDIKDELETLEDGEEIELYNYTIKCEEE